jgi:hypothetical protein
MFSTYDLPGFNELELKGSKPKSAQEMMNRMNIQRSQIMSHRFNMTKQKSIITKRRFD